MFQCGFTTSHTLETRDKSRVGRFQLAKGSQLRIPQVPGRVRGFKTDSGGAVAGWLVCTPSVLRPLPPISPDWLVSQAQAHAKPGLSRKKAHSPEVPCETLLSSRSHKSRSLHPAVDASSMSTSTPKAQGHHGREARKNGRAREWGGVL